VPLWLVVLSCREPRKPKTIDHRGTETQRKSKARKPEMPSAFFCALSG
jgi:hypothetical protein